ncbi:MAG: proline--tRNA ligase [Deltaproteobacteria bacterium]|nr:proline--tRNA ligase [Deltaproteobacteria bacterium]
MRYSEMFLPTVREVPSDAETVSHKLMIRAGMIRKLTSGIYSYLPLGYRVIRKVENIIREEMHNAGAQEVFLPMVQPAELWQESGRWVHYGKELLRFTDRHDREYCLGPTHEEVITDLVRHEVKSYRQLPVTLYQIQTKFRDEIRPRFGVMRCREFGMKDAYSFDATEEGAEINYEKMYAAYNRIFMRLGLKYRAVEADSGSIGGSYSHEFMVIASSGEDALVFCSACDYAANLEKAGAATGAPKPEKTEPVKILPRTEVHTPDIKTIEDVCAFLNVLPVQVVKTVIFNADGSPVVALVRGDEEINPIKLKNYLGCEVLELAKDDMIREVTGAPRGFAGAIGIKARMIEDYSLANMSNFVMGANREDYHLLNVNRGRDFEVSECADLRFVREGDTCIHCGSALKFARGIEVGHVFKLGTKYSQAMKAVYLDANGREQVMIMGCYGIGIGRTVAASIEQNHDDNGIIWPLPIAPYQVAIVPVNSDDARMAQAAEGLYQALSSRGFEVIMDDRNERAGVKFKDADLIGIPYRITIGPKNLAEGKVEIRERGSGAMNVLPLEQVVNFITGAVRKENE